MSEYVICGRCPAEYKLSQIEAFLDGEAITTLDRLQAEGAVSPKPSLPAKLLGLGTRQAAKQGPNLDGLRRLRDYTFRCPEGHLVDGNAGMPFGIGILGASGASKSHWLTGIVREMFDMSALRGAGVSMRKALYTNPQLAQNTVQVYRQGRSLPSTDPGEVLGPYGYKLVLRDESEAAAPKQYSLLLYDVAGEDLGAITRIAEQAPFVLLCKALVVLIDPVDFLPTQFDVAPTNERTRLDAASDVRDGIQVIADTLAEVWEAPSSRELEIPICFALAKADAVEWTGDFDWTSQTKAVIDAAGGEGGLREALRVSSSRTRDALVQLGGGLVVDEIEDCFKPEVIRYVAASATSAMPVENPGPDESDWEDDPEPNGVALSVLQVLDAAGALHPAAVPAGA